MKNTREVTRNTFDASADEYERVRPSYPDMLIEDAIGLSRIPEGGRILEIGCGTGKATELFASRGYRMDCLEIGRDLAAVAAAKFRENPNVRIVISPFEDWDPCGCAYDLVIAAASLHWVDPAVRFTKSAEVLQPTGALAAFGNRHVRRDEGFFRRVQDVYASHAPSMKRVAAGRRKLWEQPVIGEDLFHEPEVRHLPWVTEHDADDYVALLGTYSDHLSLPEEERTSLFACIKELIRDEFEGRVRKHYDAVLTLWRMKQRPNHAVEATSLGPRLTSSVRSHKGDTNGDRNIVDNGTE